MVKKQTSAKDAEKTSAEKKSAKELTTSRIKELEDELKKTVYNKRTQHHIGLIKAKLAMLKEKDVARRSKGAKGEGYSVRKSGDGTVILVGFPSAGKSSLLNEITNANSPVGAYEFTTLDVVPGLMEHKSAKIQILDVPGIVEGAASGRGRGKEVLAVMQSADLVLILLDVLRPNAHEVIKKEIYDANLRLNQIKPDVKIKKTGKGGIQIGKTLRLTKLNDETIKGICKEFRINNADIVIRDDIDAGEFIDVLEGNKIYLPGISIINKIDLVDEDRLNEIVDEVNPDLCISAQTKINIDRLKDVIFDALNFIRIYCKEIGKPADMGVPLILREGADIRHMCQKLHKDFVIKFKFSKVWGKSAKFPGQRQMLKHVLLDGDVVELHMR